MQKDKKQNVGLSDIQACIEKFANFTRKSLENLDVN